MSRSVTSPKKDVQNAGFTLPGERSGLDVGKKLSIARSDAGDHDRGERRRLRLSLLGSHGVVITSKMNAMVKSMRAVRAA